MPHATLGTIDISVILIYLVGITVLGIRAGYRRQASGEQYFLAGKSLGWFAIGLAMFASNISTLHLVGLAAAGANQGMVIGNFEWMAVFSLLLLSLLFAPFYIRTGIRTLPEFLERRYGSVPRLFLSLVAITMAMLIHMGITMFAAAKLFEGFLGIGVWTSLPIIAGVTLLYTVLGGLRAVVITETVQAFLLLGGAVLVTVLSVAALPSAGIGDLASFQAALKPDQMSMLHPLHDAQGGLDPFSWVAMVFAFQILGISYWCSDQTIVQRMLGARSQRDAQLGAIFTGFLKILPVFVMVVPGMIGWILYQKGIIRLGADAANPDYNQVLPAMINHLVPVGLKGLLAAGLVAATMSTTASALNSVATVVSVDVVKKWRPATSDRAQVLIGRICTALVMGLAMLWSTQGDQFGTIFEAINKIPMMFAPVVTTLFVFGVLWKRGTTAAAIATIIVGGGLGVAYFVGDIPSLGGWWLAHPRAHFAGLVSDPVQGLGIPFMMVGLILLAVCVVVYVATSLLTPPPPASVTDAVCWDHPLACLRSGRLTGPTDPRLLAGILVAIMLVLFACFH